MAETIKEYLVSLGFGIDQPGLRRFEDAVKKTTQAAEAFAKSIGVDLAKAAGVTATALAAVTAGTIGLATHAANMDLNYRIFARRMMMGADAARSMSIALDALGVSLEEVVWGPPELGERYRQLIKDQKDMIAVLGGDTGEKALRKIRDIEFEFTRMGPEVQRLGIRLTEDVFNKLFGGHDSLENRLKGFNEWFKQHIPDISDKVSNILVPALKLVGHALEGIYSLTVKGIEALDRFAGKNFGFGIIPTTQSAWSRAHPGMLDVTNPDYARPPVTPSWMNPRGLTPGEMYDIDKQVVQSPGILMGLWDKSKSVNQNLHDLFGTSQDQLVGQAAGIGRRYGGAAGASEFLALIQQESGFNPSLRNKRTGAIGLGQVLPGNWPAGKDPNDPQAQMEVAAAAFFGAVKAHHGDVQAALNDYYGHGKPGPGEPTFPEYFQQWQQKYQTWQKQNLDQTPGGSPPNLWDPSVAPQAQSVHPSSYSITIHVDKTTASADDIGRAVQDGIAKFERTRATHRFARAQGAFA